MKKMQWTKNWAIVSGFVSKDIIYEKKYFPMGGIARITMARTNPKGLNTITLQMQSDMITAMRNARLDRSIGVVVIQGAGEKSFCVGGDVSEEKKDSQQAMEESPDLEFHLRLLGKPIIV
jgi:naphthoate synthase